MPNWCANTVEIYHNDPVMLERARKGFNEGKLLNEFMPCPEDLQITAGFLGHDTPEQRELERKEQENIKKYGHKNWYDWQVANWGTKWDVGGDGMEAQDIPGGLMLTFDSAWSPPCDAYATLVEMGFSIRAMYYEPGMGFAGIWEDGCDDFYDYSGMNSTEIADALPEVLDEAFCISESAAEYEAENADEE